MSGTLTTHLIYMRAGIGLIVSEQMDVCSISIVLIRTRTTKANIYRQAGRKYYRVMVSYVEADSTLQLPRPQTNDIY